MSAAEIFTMITTGIPGALIVMAIGLGLLAILLTRRV